MRYFKYSLRTLSLLLFLHIITVSSFVESRSKSNEKSAIITLRSIAKSQNMFKNDKKVDQNANGVGEYALLEELTATSPLRNSGSTLLNAYITRSLAPIEGKNYGQKAGYYFQIFLPKSIEQQENKWIAYAWPKTYDPYMKGTGSGRRCFVIDYTENIYATANYDSQQVIYEGDEKTPTYNTALSHLSGKILVNEKSADGQLWSSDLSMPLTTSDKIFIVLLTLFLLNIVFCICAQCLKTYKSV